MMDFEDLILERQEKMELWEDGCIDTDDCSLCEYLTDCRKAAEGKGEYPPCPMQEWTR